MRQVQQEKNGDMDEENGENGEADRVRLDGGGYYDTEIYENRGNKYSHYNQSIAVDDNEVSNKYSHYNQSIAVDDNEVSNKYSHYNQSIAVDDNEVSNKYSHYNRSIAVDDNEVKKHRGGHAHVVMVQILFSIRISLESCLRSPISSD